MQDSESLQELIQRVKAGDEQSAAELVQQYEPELRRFVRYRLTDRRLRLLLDSLDVTQSVFARFFAALADDRLEVLNVRQFVKLLQTMATNRLRDHVRRRGAAKRTAGDGRGEREPLETVAATDAGPSEAAEAFDLVEVFRSRLDIQDRDILDRRLQGDGWTEIVGRFGSTPDALRKRLSRAIDQIAQQLDLLGP